MRCLHPLCHDFFSCYGYILFYLLPDKLRTNSPLPHQHHAPTLQTRKVTFAISVCSLHWVDQRDQQPSFCDCKNQWLSKSQHWQQPCPPKQVEGWFVVLVFLQFPPSIDDLLSWIHCWYNCDNIVVHPMENMESSWIIVVIENIKSLIGGICNWLWWPAFPCPSSPNPCNTNTSQFRLTHNLWQSKIIVHHKNIIGVFSFLLFVHSRQACYHVHNNVKDLFLFHPSTLHKGIDKACDRVGASPKLEASFDWLLFHGMSWFVASLE